MGDFLSITACEAIILKVEDDTVRQNPKRQRICL
jgi:hypothetical protein